MPRLAVVCVLLALCTACQPGRAPAAADASTPIAVPASGAVNAAPAVPASRAMAATAVPASNAMAGIPTVPASRAMAGVPAVPASRAVVAAPSAQATLPVDTASLHITLFGDRLRVEDSAHGWPLYLDKSTKDFVLQGMAPFGTPKASNAPDDCPAGPLQFLDYPNGLQLAFLDGTLAGYWVREGAHGIATAHGVHPGSPRAALAGAPLTEASFGVLADLDGVIALLDDHQRKVTALYAGAACIYD